jgi:hypothetical protein
VRFALSGALFFGTCRSFRDDVARRSDASLTDRLPTSAAVPMSRTLWAGDVGQEAKLPVEAMSPSRLLAHPSRGLYGRLCSFLVRKSR